MPGEIPKDFEPTIEGHLDVGAIGMLVYGLVRRGTNDQPEFDAQCAVNAITSAYVIGDKQRAADFYRKLITHKYAEQMGALATLQQLLPDEVFSFVSAAHAEGQQ